MENKRYRGAAAGEVECRLLIPSKMGGAVIGKKGSNIQKLRSEFSANIRIPDAPGPERIMGITSEELITCCQVVEASLPFMFEDEDENRDREIRVLFHQSVVGGIIGKGGSKIQEIREASGANVKAFQNCAPSSSDRVVAIKGPSSSLVRALEMCLEVAQENSDRSGRGVAYDPANFDAYYSDEYGGYGTADRYSGAARRGGPMMGRGGGGGYGRGFGGYGSEEGPYHTGFGFARGGGGGGSRGGYGNPRGGFNAGPDQFGRGGGGGPMMGFGGFGAGRQADRFGDDDFSGGFGGNFGGDEGEMKTSQSTIPKNMAGAILGPGGQRIRRIRAESRANITLGEANENDERVITIEGTDKQIEQANYLLRQAVRDHHSGGGGGRGGY